MSLSYSLVNSILQKVFVLAAGIPADTLLAPQLAQKVINDNDWGAIKDVVNSYLTDQASQLGAAALIKKMAHQGFGLTLSDTDANSVVDLSVSGQMSWADLVARAITEPEFTGRLTILENRIAAAKAFTDEFDAPFVLYTYPQDNDYSFKVDDTIQARFNEPVKAGSGNIVISNGTDTRIIDVNDTTQVTFDDFGNVIINPKEDLVPNTRYHILLASGVITDLAGNAYAGNSNPTMLDFMTLPSNPLAHSSTPWNGAQDFQVDSNIVGYFDEPVKAGSGNIVISNGTDTRIIDVNDTTQVTFADFDNVIINPKEDLVPNTRYHILLASGVITDLAGNPYAGISDSTTLNFTTIPSNPVLSGSIPWDNATDFFQVDSDIQLGFNEPVKAGSGNIVISNGTDTRIIDVNDTTQVTFDDFGSVIINPKEALVPNTDYHIELTNGVITDLAGNAYAGITDPTTLNFTTIPSNPVLFGSNPWDDATDVQVDSNIQLTFNEAVKAGSGNIVISNGTDTRIIDVNDISQVSFETGKYHNGIITINPTDDLVPNTAYHIELASGVIIDLVGNPYAGISDSTTLNFTTI